MGRIKWDNPLVVRDFNILFSSNEAAARKYVVEWRKKAYDAFSVVVNVREGLGLRSEGQRGSSRVQGNLVHGLDSRRDYKSDRHKTHALSVCRSLSNKAIARAAQALHGRCLQ